MEQDTDETMAGIAEAVEWGRAGRTGAARERLTELWGRIGPAGDPFHRCTLAHYLADLQEDPAEELRWDLRALEAADTLTDERAQRHDTSLQVAAFRPSLQLNLAEDYRKLGRPDQAREHLALARESLPALGDDPYGQMIRDGVVRLGALLAATDPTAGPVTPGYGRPGTD
ncbi:hypothetical protein GCM10022225_29890 [Plantactinospora mayteni]|uniref:Tetratricopeptide repeat protein n=1 Tax=Plantactinospora mayteni TaxID=566021 RepID=A0ABQ4EVH7_9ACTN|nr:hypothetical protein [Plantactinospora mayteni]GIG98625.1 hypothetical protein Pma05_51980 [Plantactinospora mayteni]